MPVAAGIALVILLAVWLQTLRRPQPVPQS
jgi:hypothetical protein